MNWFSPNKVIIQGITAYKAAFYAVQMKAYGTNIVAGISPGNGGTHIEDIPVFDLVEQALTEVEQIDISLIFVDYDRVLDAVTEAIAAGIRQIIIFTPRVPPLDTIKLIKYARQTNTTILGPGSHGIIIPQRVCLGNLQPQYYQPGKVGTIATSRHLSYEVAAELHRANMGQSIVVSLGTDRIIGSRLHQWLTILDEDPNTEVIIAIGQKINEATEIITHCKDRGNNKPIIVYLAGLKAPQEKDYHDAATIISNRLSASNPVVNRDLATGEKLKKVGIKIAKKPSEIPPMIEKALAATNH